MTSEIEGAGCSGKNSATLKPLGVEHLIPAAPSPRYDGNTALHLYMNEVAESNLLTQEEEIELAARIKKGDTEALDRLIKSNLRLVVKIAYDYENYGLPLLDLINEGNIGLMKAAKRYDPSKGGKLSTYGSWWIKQSIKRALSNQSKTIRLPIHVIERITKIRRTAAKLEETLGYEPTDEQVARELGMSARRVTELRAAAIGPASLDAPIGQDETNSFADMVADEKARTPFEELEFATLKKMLFSMLSVLDSREAQILRHRFGMDGERIKTLDEVGCHFKISRERVRQLQNTALAKLRDQIATVDGEQLFYETQHHAKRSIR